MMVFQKYALFPHLTVRQNVASAAHVDDLLDRFGIAHLADARPRAVRRRAAACRARPRARARRASCSSTSRSPRSTRTPEPPCVRSCSGLLRTLGLPTLVVTHDFEDAASLADLVGVIVDGRIASSRPRPNSSPARRRVRRLADRREPPARDREPAAWRAHAARVRGHRLLDRRRRGAAAAIVYPWDVTLARGRPTTPRRTISAAVSSVDADRQPGARRRRAVTAEVTAESAERLGVARASGSSRRGRRLQRASSRSS